MSSFLGIENGFDRYLGRLCKYFSQRMHIDRDPDF